MNTQGPIDSCLIVPGGYSRRRLLGGAATLAAAGAMGWHKDATAQSPPISVVLRSQTEQNIDGDLVGIAKAVGAQVNNDVSPIWNVDAAVTSVSKGTPFPSLSWQVRILDSPTDSPAPNRHEFMVAPGIGTIGFASVFLTDLNELPRQISHEVLEMLVNPDYTRFEVLPSLQTSQGNVLYAVEICDPCQGSAAAYKVDGYMLSDFITTDYFNADHSPIPGLAYSFRENVKAPFDIQEGCGQNWLSISSVFGTTEWWTASLSGGTMTIAKQ